jgi:hypothetical protein
MIETTQRGSFSTIEMRRVCRRRVSKDETCFCIFYLDTYVPVTVSVPLCTNCGSTGHKCIDLYSSRKVFLWPVDPQFVAVQLYARFLTTS